MSLKTPMMSDYRPRFDMEVGCALTSRGISRISFGQSQANWVEKKIK